MESSQDEITQYIKDNPLYSRENIDAFAALHAGLGIHETALKLLIRNEYIYAMPYNERPKVDLMYDTALIAAVDYLKEGK